MAVFETTVNISTKNQRRGDVIQNKWVSKNTLVNKGDLVVGTGASTGALITGDSYTDVANVNVITVGTDGYPLVANSAAALGLAYQKIDAVGISDGAITLSKINSSVLAVTRESVVNNNQQITTANAVFNAIPTFSNGVGISKEYDSANNQYSFNLRGMNSGDLSVASSSYIISAHGVYSFYVPGWSGSHGDYPGDQLIFNYDRNFSYDILHNGGNGKITRIGHFLGKVINESNGQGYSQWDFTPVLDTGSGKYLSVRVTLSYYVVYYNTTVDENTSFYTSILFQY
jgi:hypothetical protein